jgi:predicted MPP superfamily phosphohydrolase
MDVAVERHEVEVPLMESRVFRPGVPVDSLRIAFAADFHAGPNTPDALIDKAIEQLTLASPDVLLLGGDFVSVRDAYMGDLAPRLATIPAPLGRYAVLGNHDHWVGGDAVATRLRDAGIDVLTNCNVRLPDPWGDVSICGLDDHTTGHPDAEAAFRGAAPTRIVLMHAPSSLLDIGDRSFAVALCGHTHGGQLSFPSGRPLKPAHGPLSRTYNAGRFELSAGRVLLVSRGVGYSTLPLRVNAPAAVMVCTLKAATGRKS